MEEGNTATFGCSATYGGKTLEYHWEHDGESIQIDSEPRFTQKADGTLEIKNTLLEDRGTYKCYVTRVGRDKVLGRSKTATLTVKGKLS